MSEYIFTLLWIGAVWSISTIVSSKKVELVLGEDVVRYNGVIVAILIIPLIWIVGQRSLDADSVLYMSKYLKMPTSLETIPEYMRTVEKDKGFYYVSCVLRTIFKDNYHAYFTVIAAFQLFSLTIVYKKYSEEFFFSLFLFFASTDYISWMHNGIRQFTAVCIIFLATPFLLKKKNIIVAAFILLASLFHQSALLVLVIYLISLMKPYKMKTIFLIILSLVFFYIVASKGSFLDDTQYENVVSDYTKMSDTGTNPLRVMFYAIPTVLTAVFRKKILETNSQFVNILVNLSIFSTGLYVVSMFTSGTYIGRLPIYCSLYNYILFPYIINHYFEGHLRRYLFVGVIILYLAFYYVQMHVFWSYI